jgi:hypothetical protein
MFSHARGRRGGSPTTGVELSGRQDVVGDSEVLRLGGGGGRQGRHDGGLGWCRCFPTSRCWRGGRHASF